MQHERAEFTDRELVEQAIAALAAIETRWRKTQRGLRLPVIEQVLEFARTIPEDVER